MVGKVDRNGNASEFGWQFQVFSGIVAALKNINNIESINIEGPDQDVQLRQKNGKKLLIQAKSYTKVPLEENTNTGWGDKLASAIVGLFEDYMDNKKNIFKYYVNFPYPFGKINGGSRSFGLKNYGETDGIEITNSQKDIIKNKIIKFINEKSEKTSLKLDDVKKEYDKFIKKVSFTYWDFLNFKDENRKYELLDEMIRNFLNNNNMDISIKSLRKRWVSDSFSNGSTKYYMDKNTFLFEIIIVKNTMFSDELLGHRLNRSRQNELYDRFQTTIESTFALEEFNRRLLVDLFKFEGITKIDEFEYDEDNVADFIRHVYGNYVKFFNLSNITKKEREELTKYALEHFLLEEDTISHLLGDKLENAD